MFENESPRISEHRNARWGPRRLVHAHAAGWELHWFYCSMPASSQPAADGSLELIGISQSCDRVASTCPNEYPGFVGLALDM